MKLILSRKGFDSGSGGMPSPILPDGTLLSMPIPDDGKAIDTKVKYSELSYGNINYLDLIKQLKPSFDKIYCHLDPDLRRDIKDRSHTLKWEAAFGQEMAALSHLYKNGVCEGDVFLFYGWFRQTEFDELGHLKFVRKAPDIHCIYGYLQVKEIITGERIFKDYAWHPHADLCRRSKRLNAIYIPEKHFLETALPGYGTFSFSEKLVLTKKNESRSHWKLPECMVGKNISYHDQSSYRNGYFQSAMRGQEFVMDVDTSILEWLQDIITKHAV